MKWFHDKFNTGFSDGFIMFSIFACVWILRLVTLDSYPIPIPAVHDEQANILGAETFAEGRLTNLPIAKDLQDSLLEIHVLPEPTRMMKYQPAMAAFMAIGIKLFGDAYWGVVLLMSFAITASYWAMRGWASWQASILFSLYILLEFKAPHYWIYSYWGGGHVLLGAFLLIGAYPRIFYQKKFSFIGIAMLGLLMLALSRPFEGGVLVISSVVVGCVDMVKKFSVEEKTRFFRHSLLPVLLIGSILISFQMYYNKAITGNVLELPYIEYAKQRDVAPSFVFGKINNSLLSEHYALKNSQNVELKTFNKKLFEILKFPSDVIINIFPTNGIHKILNFLDVEYADKYIKFLQIFFAFILPLILLILSFVRKEYIFLSFCFFVQSIALLTVTWHRFPHYFAIWFALYVILLSLYIIKFINFLYVKKINIIGVVICVFFVGIVFISIIIKDNKFADFRDEAMERHKLSSYILELDGINIVFVNQKLQSKYGDLFFNFVYNEPDIDKSKIIWAWDMSQEQNKKLIEAYPNRKLWYIEPYKEQKLIPYYEKYPQ